VNYNDSLVVTTTVICFSRAPSSGEHLFTCGAICLPPHNTQCTARQCSNNELVLLLKSGNFQQKC